MSAITTALRAPSPLMMALELRTVYEFGGFLCALPLLRQAPRGDGHPVLVLPGFMNTDRATGPLRHFLTRQGYAVSGWEQGRNYGPRDGVETRILTQIARLNDQYGRKISLVGWSLGGLYARQCAKTVPDKIRGVITLGSPFAGTPKATNVWRLYEFISGQRVDEIGEHPAGPLAEKPPTPTTAIYSRTDGTCAWQACFEPAGPLAESIEVKSSHNGLRHNPASVYAIADRLAQPEGEWSPFKRDGWRKLVYPDPAR